MPHLEDKLEVETDGECFNILYDGEIRASLNEAFDEFLVYEDDSPRPVGKFRLSDGTEK